MEGFGLDFLSGVELRVRCEGIPREGARQITGSVPKASAVRTSKSRTSSAGTKGWSARRTARPPSRFVPCCLSFLALDPHGTNRSRLGRRRQESRDADHTPAARVRASRKRRSAGIPAIDDAAIGKNVECRSGFVGLTPSLIGHPVSRHVDALLDGEEEIEERQVSRLRRGPPSLQPRHVGPRAASFLSRAVIAW